MKLKTLILSSILATSVVFTSCNHKSHEDEITVQNISNCVNFVTDASGNTTMLSNVDYSIKLNYTRNVGTLEIAGLQLGDSKYPTFKLSDMPFKIDERGFKVLSAAHPTVSSTVAGQAPAISMFEFATRDHLLADQVYVPLLYCEYQAGEYSVASFMNPMAQLGKTTSVAPDGTKYEFTSPAYILELSPTTFTCDISILNAQFHPDMPSFAMDFKNIPFSYKDGVIMLRADALTPEISKQPYPAFPITNLKADISVKKGMMLTFNCGVKGEVYAVTVDCLY